MSHLIVERFASSPFDCRVLNLLIPGIVVGAKPAVKQGRRRTTAVHMQFLEDVVDVVLDGSDADSQGICYLLVGESLVDQLLDDHSLPLREAPAGGTAIPPNPKGVESSTQQRGNPGFAV